MQLVGSGDALHPKWLDIIEESTEYMGDGIYSHPDCDFILTTEVEAKHKIHHVIIIPDIKTARELSDALPSNNKLIDGRPKTSLDGGELYDLVKQYDCMIGPAHAFTPWTGMYKSHDSIYDCYGNKPDFVELGLSADTDMADTISELEDFVFLTLMPILHGLIGLAVNSIRLKWRTFHIPLFRRHSSTRQSRQTMECCRIWENII